MVQRVSLTTTSTKHTIVLYVIIALLCGVLTIIPQSGLIFNSQWARAAQEKPPATYPTPWRQHQRVKWDVQTAITETVVQTLVPGYTIFKNIYMMNKTWYIVADDALSPPPVRNIVNNQASLHLKQVKPDMKVISSQEAHDLFGSTGIQAPGLTFSNNDQFVALYHYHAGDILLGLWQLYAQLNSGVNITTFNDTTLHPVAQWLSPHASRNKWGNYAQMNQFIISAAFPFASVWGKDEWDNLEDPQLVSKFDQLVLTESGRMEKNTRYWKEGRFTAVGFQVLGDPNWWATIRRSVLASIEMGMTEMGAITFSSKYTITYISTQKSGRTVLKKDHQRLVQALQTMERDHGWEVNIVVMEHLNRTEQVRLAARTTILMGVQGTGLTHMLWMDPTSKSSIFEFYRPGEYTADNAWPAAALGLAHYGFWDNTYFKTPEVPQYPASDARHYAPVPIDAEAVVRLCVDILSKK